MSLHPSNQRGAFISARPASNFIGRELIEFGPHCITYTAYIFSDATAHYKSKNSKLASETMVRNLEKNLEKHLFKTVLNMFKTAFV